MTRQCCTCGRAEDHTLNDRGKQTVELRPYGPGGADICFQCAFATPSAEAQTKHSFGAILEATEAISPTGVAVIGADTNGPQPFHGSPDERAQILKQPTN